MLRGSDIKRAREARGWSQAQMAKILDTSHETVNRWENEKIVLRGPQRFAIVALMPELGKPQEESKRETSKRSKS